MDHDAAVRDLPTASSARDERKSPRLHQLDALRGIAAVLVVLHHAYQTWPVWPQIVRFTPARLLLNGRSSVIFFFVLSGFVLAHGLMSGRPQPYGVFVLRRIARIYLPYAVAGGLAILGALMFAGVAVPGVGITFDEMWTGTPDAATALGHLALVGNAAANAINLPSWSLVYELRISLLIPPLVLGLRAAPRATVIATVVLVAAAELFLWRTGAGAAVYGAEGLAGNLAATTHFLGCFVVGILLAKAALGRPAALFDMSLGVKRGLALAAFALVMVFRDATCALGSALIILLALNSAAFAAVLSRPLLAWLGRVSFSLYLTHMVVIEAMLRGTVGLVPPPVVLGVALFLVLPVAAVFFKLVEQPSHRLAKAIGPRGARDESEQRVAGSPISAG